MTTTTLAFRVQTFDTPPQLTTQTLPAPAKDEVRLRVGACGLNFADLLMTTGRYQDTPTPPFTLGLELSGTVEPLATSQACILANALRPFRATAVWRPTPMSPLHAASPCPPVSILIPPLRCKLPTAHRTWRSTTRHGCNAVSGLSSPARPVAWA